MPAREIKSPRRIFMLGGPDSGVLPLLEGLTGTRPISQVRDYEEPGLIIDAVRPDDTAGLIHCLELDNAYYRASIPIWVDETSNPSDWETDYLSEGAGEVVTAVGAWVVVFRLTQAKDNVDRTQAMMHAVKNVISAAHDGDESLFDGSCLAVGWPTGVVGNVGTIRASSSSTTQAAEDDALFWEDCCLDNGFEFVDGRRSGEKDSRGEVGGIARLREALEATSWDGCDDDVAALSFDSDDELGDFQTGDGVDSSWLIDGGETARDDSAPKMEVESDAPWPDDSSESDQAIQVQELERMMQKAMAIREMSSHMSSEEQRKKFAAKAINDMLHK